MSDSTQAVQVLVNRNASRLAFEAGRVFQRRVMARALDAVRSEAAGSGEGLVDVEHIWRALADMSLEEVIRDLSSHDAPDT